jgi:uncharacterized metal-binding protein
MEQKGISKLYDSPAVEIMRTAADAFERNANRVQEIKNFARKAGIKRIGIAHCVAVMKEADAVKAYLSDEFEVFSIDCKYGKIAKQQMFEGGGSSILCNPAGQAEYLKENKTEINLLMGLCVGHDMIFNQKSAVPVTTLLVKDRVNKHNTLESIQSIEIA